MFTTFQNSSKGFTGDRSVTLEEFIEYHQFFNNAFENDNAFKLFLVGVWNMDLQAVAKDAYCGKHTDVYGKNSREQWKLANHRSLFGDRDSHQIGKHAQDAPNRKANARQNVDVGDMNVAGSKSWNTGSKGNVS